jgi:putative ABC transport system permease protein
MNRIATNLLQDFRVGLRLLARDPAYALTAIAGLGIGLAACLLLLGFVRYSWQYNAHVPDAQRVYVVKQRHNADPSAPWYDQVPTLLHGAARGVAGIEQAAAYMTWAPLTVTVGSRPFKMAALAVTPGFERMMGLQAMRGDAAAALARPDGLVLTEAAALRLFGTADVLDRVVAAGTVFGHKAALRVAAVVRTPPANSTIPFEALHGIASTIMPPDARQEAQSGEQGWWAYVLVKLAPGASPAGVANGLQQVLDRAPFMRAMAADTRAALGSRKAMELHLAPLTAAYFDREVTANFFSVRIARGDKTVVGGLAIVALLVLALAAINYANLATIRVIRRQREIGLRKVLGAGLGRLALQFTAEALAVSLLATVLGVLLAWLALPLFGAAMDRDLSSMSSLPNVAGALLTGVALGLLTAAYPAWTAFRVRPAQTLHGRPEAESPGGARLRKALAMLQVAAAMALASYAIAVGWQTRYAINASPGFDPGPLLVFELPEQHNPKSSAPARSLVETLRHDAAIAGVAIATDPVGTTRDGWHTALRGAGGLEAATGIKSVSADFFTVYGIAPVAGRLFSSATDREDDGEPLVLNQLAARQLGFAHADQAVGQAVQFRTGKQWLTRRVVGIAPEVRFQSIKSAPRPVAYELRTTGAVLTVRAAGAPAAAEQAIRAAWQRTFPEAPLDLRSAQDIYASGYTDDARLAGLLAVATAIALMLAASGAYVLAADAIRRRTREIALRKLHGARRRDIGKLVGRELALLVALPAVAGLPVAAVAIERYLSAYVERAPVGWWPPALALALGVAVTALASARHSWRAMRINPAVALRT